MMKNMKTSVTQTIYTVICVILLWSCKNEELNPQIDPIYAPVAVVSYTDDVNESFINAADIENEIFAFILTSEDFGYDEAAVSSVVVNLTYNNDVTVNIGDFPQSELESGKRIAFTVSEAAGLLGISAGDVKLADVFRFSFSVKTVSGTHYETYNNNICNLIRVIGDCEVEFMVLNPAAVDASIDETNAAFSQAELDGSGDDMVKVMLSKRDFASPLDIVSVDVGIMAPGATAIDELKTVNGFPDEITISASEIASLFGITTTDFVEDESYSVVFTYNTVGGSFRTFGSGNCGKTFPGSIVHPLHLPWLNPQGTSISPPPTPVEGSCDQISIAITK